MSSPNIQYFVALYVWPEVAIPQGWGVFEKRNKREQAHLISPIFEDEDEAQAFLENIRELMRDV
jgi:hypothetical protein